MYKIPKHKIKISKHKIKMSKHGSSLKGNRKIKNSWDNCMGSQ